MRAPAAKKEAPAAPKADTPPIVLYRIKYVHDPVPWYLKFVYAREKFSPRLLAAWLFTGYTARVIEHWLGERPEVIDKVLVQPADRVALIIALLSMITVLFGYGTLQTAVLGDKAPAQGLADQSDQEQPPSQP